MGKPVIETELANIILKNPIMPASGTFGYGEEFSEIYDLNLLGAVVTKSVTKEPRYGNPLPRIAECKGGMLNSIGLQNPGIDLFIEKELAGLRNIYEGIIICNISGFTTEEYGYLARRLNDEPIDMIEVNISCPNVEEGGDAFGSSAKLSNAITKEVRKNTDKPVFMKLTSNVTDISEIAKACEEGGADGISLINNFKAMKIDIKNRRTVTEKKYAGLSGDAIRPIALRMVNEVYHSIKLPIIGIGGISSAENAIEMIMAGAKAVQIGSANFRNPFICPNIITDLPKVMKENGIDSLDEIRGII